MQTRIYQFFAPPFFPGDEDQTRSAAITNATAWSILFIVVTILILRVIQGQDINLVEVNLVLIVILIAMALILYLPHKGFVRPASILLVTTVWTGLSCVAWIADGIRDVTFFALAIPILMAALLLGWRGSVTVMLASILSGWALAYAETNQLIRPSFDTALHFARDMTGVFTLIGVLIYLTISSLQKALAKSRVAAQQLSQTNQEINALRVELEKRVEERTIELRERANQLEAISGVARAIASVQDIDSLLPNITMLVSQQFGYYHVGIFLLDEAQNKAVMHAANSEAGLRLVGQGFSLTPDQHSIVGYSIVRAEPRVALNVASDSVYLNNPNLPESRSEISLPLRVAGRVIGALDVQSTESEAFSERDINVLATLADQLAIAIENARLFSEAKNALKESRVLFEKYTQQEWRNFSKHVKQTGFIFDGKQVSPLDSITKQETVRKAIHTGRLALEKESASIAVPIKLRGQTIGVLDVRSKKGTRLWKQDEIMLLEAAAERAALALENARLIENAQRRVARERAIGDISAKIGAVSNLESILQTAVEELGRKIGGATEVSLEISSDDAQNAAE